jgi:transposase-like protein
MTRRKRYSAEFKREALRRANEVGVTDVLVAEELGINARNLRNWRDAHGPQLRWHSTAYSKLDPDGSKRL